MLLRWVRTPFPRTPPRFHRATHPRWARIRLDRLCVAGALALTALIAPPPSEAGPCRTEADPKIKWSQCPDFDHGRDILSNSFVRDMVADDFRSDGRTITDVHWWGSYTPGTEENTPDAFFISFWSDVPARGTEPSRPGIMQAGYIFLFEDTNEEFVRRQGVHQQGPQGFEYFVDLSDAFRVRALPGRLDEEGNFREREGEILWLSIWAVGATITPEHGKTSGWKTSDESFQDEAFVARGVLRDGLGPRDLVPGSMWPTDSEKIPGTNMAFELTVPAPPTLTLVVAATVSLVAWRRLRRTKR